MRHFLGIMSGTSLDAIDCAICKIDDEGSKLQLEHYFEYPLPESLKPEILKLNQPGYKNELQRTLKLDQILGSTFANAALSAIKDAQLLPEDIEAIGSHGQTIRHQPPSAISTPTESNRSSHNESYSLQIGSPHRIAFETGITTVADFRSMDIAAGGEGAPLVPQFHQAVFQSEKQHRIIINIGGMANITLLNKNEAIAPIGFDTGPGNCLMNHWIQQHREQAFDKDGTWALSGTINSELISNLMSEQYFSQSYPKSTGRELFDQYWLTEHLNPFEHLSPEDIQASLLELSATSIVKGIKDLENLHHNEYDVFLCGGGSQNKALKNRIAELINKPVSTTEALGLHPDTIEAAAFAWLAQQRLDNIPANQPEVTGAKKHCLLGAIFQA